MVELLFVYMKTDEFSTLSILFTMIYRNLVILVLLLLLKLLNTYVDKISACHIRNIEV